MNSNFRNIPLFVIQQNCDLVIDQICQKLCSAGFQTLPTFNLKTSLPADKCCGFPPDGCDCQVAILLVYGKDGLPFSLSLFGEGDKTTVALSDSHGDGAMITGLLAGKLDENVLQLL